MFQSPEGDSLRLQSRAGDASNGTWKFQSPEGDSLRLQSGEAKWEWDGTMFQSPEGDSLRLQSDFKIRVVDKWIVSVPRRGQPKAAIQHHCKCSHHTAVVSVPRRGQPKAAIMDTCTNTCARFTGFSPPKGTA